MNLKYKILAVLAATVLLTACGGNTAGSPAASAPASSAAAASSRVPETGVAEPVNMLWQLDSLDDAKTTTIVSADIASEVKDGKVTIRVYSYDIYDKEAVDRLAAGDKIVCHKEYMTGNQLAEIEVQSIEKNDEYQIVSINGGMENGDGLDLMQMDENRYRTLTFDDYPVYYEMGEKTMPLAEDVVLKDSSADPQAEAVETTGADAVAEAINADPDNWTTYNTTLVVQGGKVPEVRRIWVP